MKYLPYALSLLSFNILSADLLEYEMSAKVSKDFAQIILADKTSWQKELLSKPEFGSERIEEASCKVSILRPVFGESEAFANNNISCLVKSDEQKTGKMILSFANIKVQKKGNRSFKNNWGFKGVWADKLIKSMDKALQTGHDMRYSPTAMGTDSYFMETWDIKHEQQVRLPWYCLRTSQYQQKYVVPYNEKVNAMVEVLKNPAKILEMAGGDEAQAAELAQKLVDEFNTFRATWWHELGYVSNDPHKRIEMEFKSKIRENKSVDCYFTDVE